MSIYKNAKTGRYWAFDFQQRGRRFYGSTGQTDRGRALEVEKTLKLKAKLGTLHQVEDMTLDRAAQRWWEEVGQHLARADKLEAELGRVIKLVGPGLLLTEVTTSRMAAAIAKRRAQTVRGGHLPSPITVNREIIANVRRILNHAQSTWEVQGMPKVDWKRLKLAEPRPKIRGDFTPAEIEALLEALPEHWQEFVHFSKRYGCRLGEMFFPLSAVDVERRRVTLRERKGDDDHAIPILQEDATMLAARIGRARRARIDTVWFRELRGGRLKALTYWAASGAIHKAMRDSGLKASKGARLHDLRHHAGTEILRASKNLKVAQRLLGHASIATTMRYAHALDDDVRAGLEAMAATLEMPEPAAVDEEAKTA